ncbi:hypothetical protein HYPBUDRAFT_148595 [Hyphopichia burtonii NRRL Y-1933]|uniref:Uncharacterized protein n=1 Tax=Hyphopichia burtonii NRRL Y-1933 TaxID=984485 RepID=A0A1E4RI70_9ASCO|nr:hypothetical protein HYPBUDRAFT_148595 [Hyphopichia burtonii NRRL Y-1933]ODV66795.1 hypothetical protein HYPBUDRAFT_148595 [Hyphopichia burtonii NRRL Y-1933]
MSGPEITDSEKDTVPREDIAKKVPEDESTGSGSGVSGILNSAKNAVGLNQGQLHQGKSLVSEADSYEDVQKAPKHEQSGGKEEKEKQPDEESNDSKDVSAEAKAKAKETEDKVTSHNKQQGINKNDDRDLIDVAIDADGAIGKENAHKGVSIQEEDGDDDGKPNDNVQKVPMDFYRNESEFVKTGGKHGEL